MLNQMSLWDLPSATSSPELECGATHCGKLDFQTVVEYGPDPAHASLSARQAKELGLLTSGTYGLRSSGSSSSASLQSSLENKLRELLASAGSTLYRLTWRHAATPAGRQLLLQRASALPISDPGFTGRPALPTPTARDYRGQMSMENLERRKSHPRGVNLQEFMQRELGFPGYLNPELPRLLMGLPPAWDELGAMAMQLMPSKRKRSSSHTLRAE